MPKNWQFTKFIPIHSTQNNNIIFQKMINIITGNIKNIKIYDMTGYIYDNIVQEIINFSKMKKNDIDCCNYNILVDMNGNIMLISNSVKIFIVDNIIYIVNNVYDFKSIISSEINYVEHDNCIAFYKFIFDNNVSANLIMKNKTAIQYTTYNLNEHFDLNIYFTYQNNENNIKLIHNLHKKNNGSFQENYIKNGMIVSHKYDNTKKISKIISQCMINDTNGVRYRGKYEEIKSKDKNKKTLTKDDEIIYNKEDGKVLIDKINTLTIKEDIVIGWKVAKSLNGEKRIIKLAIPIDAIKITPINHEYFNSRGKERCNKAIVMDIQFPFKDEIISIVPHEMSAYSYIYNENDIKLEYKVGMEVVPDSFDDNINETCTNGIHYYRERNTVFDVYL
jgi:hypothetical protein